MRIQLPYGHVAGKWWGPKNIRPIVALHGWQDNAGTFDTLIPLLPSNISFLALDLPGHGLSSRIPDGMSYHSLDNLLLLNHIMKEYNWEKISLIGHSMGSVLGFIFASTFPNKVDFFIGLDALKPHITPPEKVAHRLEKNIMQLIQADKRNRENSEPPSYTYDELIERLHMGTFQSITKEACPYLLKRAIKKSSKYPDKYYFARDSRLKAHFGWGIGQDVCLNMAKRINMPYLFIKCKKSPFYEDIKYFNQVIDVLKENNQSFQLNYVDGTHHVHLTNPSCISGFLTNFLNKYWISLGIFYLFLICGI